MVKTVRQAANPRPASPPGRLYCPGFRKSRPLPPLARPGRQSRCSRIRRPAAVCKPGLPAGGQLPSPALLSSHPPGLLRESDSEFIFPTLRHISMTGNPGCRPAAAAPRWEERKPGPVRRTLPLPCPEIRMVQHQLPARMTHGTRPPRFRCSHAEWNPSEKFPGWLPLHRAGAGRILSSVLPRGSCLIFMGTEAPVAAFPFSAAASPASEAGLSFLYLIFT